MTQSTAKKIIASLLLMVLATTSFAETPAEKFQLNFYGNFIHTQKIPNALFYFDKIKKNDSFDLRKAMRNHDIDTIVLSSGGGSVYEGLQMAGIIRDNKLTTYVPEWGLVGEGNCASACAFMFFGGLAREASGKLGVHQFYSQNSNESAKIGNIQGGTQYTAGEIIGFLNDFGTPAFVFEKMFQRSDMYYFNKAEIERLGAGEGTLTRSERMKINSFIQNFVSEIEKLDSTAVAAAPPKVQTTKKKKPPSSQSGFAVIKAVQMELKRLGCMPGFANGVVDTNHKRAANRFNHFNGSFFDVETFFTTKNAVTYLQSKPSGLCLPSSVQTTKKKKPTPQSDVAVIKAIQTELNRIGCKLGKVDGLVGPASKRALNIFNKTNNSYYSAKTFFTARTMTTFLRGKPAGFCPVAEKNKTKVVPQSDISERIRVQSRYELLVNCGKKNKKHWLHFYRANTTGWYVSSVPSNVKYSFTLQNNGRGEYGLCGGLTCHWQFAGWAINQNKQTLKFKVNKYATEYSAKPAGFNGTYLISKDGRTISGTDSNGCSVRGTAK
tara:strand:- start:507 stop:2156 length:1650 start_codon:yes stop_codon:yes gene_type:complete